MARGCVSKGMVHEHGVAVSNHNAAWLVEPWQVATQKGDPYRVFTPFWRAARAGLPAQFALTPAPATLPALQLPIAGHTIDALGLSARPQWDAGFWPPWQPGEAGAHEARSEEHTSELQSLMRSSY